MLSSMSCIKLNYKFVKFFKLNSKLDELDKL